jgi:cytochrome c oxidase subunit II
MFALDRLVFLSIALVVFALAAIFAWAAMVDVVQQGAALKDAPPVQGIPIPWQLNFQFPFSPLARGLFRFHNFLFGINIAICAIVLILILFVVWRFRSSRNPIPSSVTHNTALEVTWTILPVVTLLVIAIPSFRLLSRASHVPADAQMTLKVTGHQWFWEYAYPDQGGFQFSSLIVPDDKLPADQKGLRLLMADQLVVLPIETTVRVYVTSADVIHSWAVPSLGVKKDAIPGRLNETWLSIDREGMFFGQCSVLCGANHAFMPIAIQAVPKQRFEQWVEDAKKKWAGGIYPAQNAAKAQLP